MTAAQTATRIRTIAAEMGFSRVRTCPVDAPVGIEHYDAFLAEGRHADMEWMARGRAPRADLESVLPGARALVALGIDHFHPRPPDPGGLTGRVARYAWGRDYHNLVGKRLRKMAKALRKEGVGCRSGVDASPFIERAWAERAGLAYLGRNCCAIVPGEGSWMMLAVLIVDVDLPDDGAIRGMDAHCGRCRRCLDVCPTDAFIESGRLDARRCISWLTIENRGTIPEVLRAPMGRWVFGCDDCQDVCPHNHAPPPSPFLDLAPRPGHAWLDLEWVLDTPDDALDKALNGSPLRRARPLGLKRNAAVVLGNMGDDAAVPPLRRALDGHPLVAEHARWALDRLGG